MITQQDIQSAAKAAADFFDEQAALKSSTLAGITSLSNRISKVESRLSLLEASATPDPIPAPSPEIDRRKFITVPVEKWDAPRVAKRIETLGTNAKSLRDGVIMLQQFRADGRIRVPDGVDSDTVILRLNDMAAQAENALQTCLAIREGLNDAGLI